MTIQEALKKQTVSIEKMHGAKKYHNQKTVVDGIEFDSRKEANRYAELKLLQRAGEISGLALQVSYVLIPEQKRDGKIAEREVKYIADFVYTDKDGNRIVEDVKSPATRTKEYILKRKMMLWEYGIKIVEV